MFQEPINSRFAPSRQDLGKLKELADRAERVPIRAGSSTLPLEEVLDEEAVPDFLVCHVLQEEAFLGSNADFFKLLVREAREAVVEEVEFDPFLVEG